MTAPVHASLFTGIGGFDLGFEAAGFATGWHAEIDKFCNRVLRTRWPEVVNLGDVSTIRGAPAADVISFGSPCQDLSVAGRRAGLDGARSGLFYEAARIVAECRPTFAIWENVAGAFSSNDGRDFGAVLDILVQLGATDVAWRVFDSQFAGVPQQRRRVYLVADFGGRRAGEILFEPTRCEGHPPPGGQAGKGVASTLTSGPKRSGRPGGSHDTDLVSKPLGSNATGGFRYDLDHDTYVVEENEDPEIAATVTSKWSKGTGGPAGDETQNLTLARTLAARNPEGDRGDLGGSGAALVVFHPDAMSRDGAALQDSPDAEGKLRRRDAGLGIRQDGPAFTHDASGVGAFALTGEDVPQGQRIHTDQAPAIGTSATGNGYTAFEPRHFTRGKAGPPSDIVPALTADSDRGDGQAVVYSPATAFDPQQITNADNRSQGAEDRSYALNTKGTMAASFGATIRRFTPLECERLQGFPDGWTCLCQPLEAWATAPAEAMARCKCADGPRYRAVGNAVTRNVPHWIALRMRRYFE